MWWRFAARPLQLPRLHRSQIFPNDESLAQSAPVKLGTSGGNANDLGTKVCCIGTLGSLWTQDWRNSTRSFSAITMCWTGPATVSLARQSISPCNLSARPDQPAAAHGCAFLRKVRRLSRLRMIPAAPGIPARQPYVAMSPSNVDAAIAEIVPGQVDLSGTILDLGPVGTTSIAAAPPSSSNLEPPALTRGKQERQNHRSYLFYHQLAQYHSIQIDYDAQMR